jgi:hypothetical protein
MRSLATAIESYVVDTNRYPIASQWVSVFNSFNARMYGLTTPVAYISSLPVDVFRRSENIFPITPGQPPTFEYTDFSTAVITANIIGGDPYPEPQTIDYGIFQNEEAFHTFYTLNVGNSLRWVLLSVGPDRLSDYQQLSLPIPAANALILGAASAYDPTNGTVSRGDVVRTQFQQRN